LSRATEETRADLLGRLVRALREQSGLGASFFRAVAARVGMPVTDLQVLDMLDSGGLTTAGQLAEASGLTTGAITGMLNRLEESGLVRRERDPNDGRKVIVRLAPGKEHMGEIHAIFAGAGQAWEELAAEYDDAQLALIVAFLERANALAGQSIAGLRDTPAAEQDVFAVPLGAATHGRLVFAAGLSVLHLRVGTSMPELYRATFTGYTPEVKTKDGTVTIRYPRRLLGGLGAKERAADVTLSAAIPWQIQIQGSGAGVRGDLGGLVLTGLEITSNAGSVHLSLPSPNAMIPVRVSGGASEVRLSRPVGVPVRAHLKGWASAFTFDDQMFSDLGNDVRLQSPDFVASAPGYDIEVSSSASAVAITAE
jgi:DNA-binding MarR family transcriptional regulator